MVRSCIKCGGMNTEIFRLKLKNGYLLPCLLCFDCNYIQKGLPYDLVIPEKLPEKTYRQAIQSSYEKYLQSDEWKFKSYQWKRDENFTCQFCGKTDCVLDAHHKTYKNLRHENRDDILILCDDCHKKVHDFLNAVRQVNKAKT